MSAALEYVDLEQGTNEWLDYRRDKITATDACIIMGASHWKTRIQLYKEKISGECNTFVTNKMARGVELEPFARSLFINQSGIEVFPKVVVKGWAMASLDGISKCGKYVVEIKCPGEEMHAIALSGKVPECYIPQLQHQMHVCDVDFMYYFSFDGWDGVILEVKRDQSYIDKMLSEEKKFFDCLVSKTPPEPQENDYIERSDELWEQCADEYRTLIQTKKDLELQEERLRKQLIFLSGESNTKGAGISLCHVTRKGNVDYSKIPELKNVDLDLYRKDSSSSWRITT